MLVLLAALALVAAGVTTAATGAAAPVRLIVIVPVATPIQNYPDAPAGAEAAAAAINRSGGIKGRTVQIDFCNTESQANTAVACARRAASGDYIASVSHASTNLITIEEPFLQAAGVPDVGNYSFGNAIDWTSPNIFPLTGGVVAAYMAAPFELKKLGKKRLAVFYQDSPASASNAKYIVNSAKRAGVQVVMTHVLPGSTTDFAPFAQLLRQADPDAVMFSNSAGPSGGVMRAAYSLGLRPLWVHNSGTIGEAEGSQIGDPAQGMLLTGAYPSARDTQYPGVRRWVAEMNAAGKGTPELLKPLGLNAWLAVWAVAKIGRSMKGELTSASLTAELRKRKQPLDLFGLVDFAPGRRGPAAFPRWSTVRVYFSQYKDGEIRTYPKSTPIEPLVMMGYVR